MEKENPMRNIRIEKVTLNAGVKGPGPELEHAKKILGLISGSNVVETKSRKRNTFGVAKGRVLGAKATLRKKKAEILLKKLLEAVDNKLKASQFDDYGNFSFGIEEYINIPGVKYDPEIGIMGMDVCVTLERPGFRVKKRMVMPGRVGKRHVIKKEEAIEFARKRLGVSIMESGD
jgi:large subunit ribosomal protein L5